MPTPPCRTRTRGFGWVGGGWCGWLRLGLDWAGGAGWWAIIPCGTTRINCFYSPYNLRNHPHPNDLLNDHDPSDQSHKFPLNKPPSIILN